MDKKDHSDEQKEIRIKIPHSKESVSHVAVFELREEKALGVSSQTFTVHKKRVVIGSIESADVKLSDDSVAPIHAVVEIHENPAGDHVATIYDLASSTGVYVNDAPIVTGSLSQADKIRIGHFVLEFNVKAASEFSPEVQKRRQSLPVSPREAEDIAVLTLEDERAIHEIFDFKPTQRPALEVVMSWSGTIVDVKHFTDQSQIKWGTKEESDFGVPPLLPDSQYVIATRSGDQYLLHLDHSMQGVIQSKGELRSLKDLVETMASGSGGAQILLGKDDFAKISVGEIDFYLSYSSAPPALKRRRVFEKDPFFMKFFFTSMLLSLFGMIGIFNIHIEKEIEPEELPERIAKILYQPEKYTSFRVPRPKEKSKTVVSQKPKPPKKVKVDIRPKRQKPKEVPKEIKVAVQKKKAVPKALKKAAKEGEGARAKGKEGSRGSRTAKRGGKPQNLAHRPSAQGGKGRGGGNSQVPSIGNLDSLKGAGKAIQNLLGNSGQKLGKGGEQLKGFGGFTSQGAGGLGLSGSGLGGGGKADTSLGGLGKKGRGGGKVGTGLGAQGSGSGIIGGKGREVRIRTGGPEEAVVLGSIDADAVEAALLAHKDEFRLCYDREINAGNPDLSGRVSTSFVIGGSGRVSKAGIVSSSLRNRSVERCLLKVIKRIDFPKPRGGGIVEVTYPFKFRPT